MCTLNIVLPCVGMGVHNSKGRSLGCVMLIVNTVNRKPTIKELHMGYFFLVCPFCFGASRRSKLCSLKKCKTCVYGVICLHVVGIILLPVVMILVSHIGANAGKKCILMVDCCLYINVRFYPQKCKKEHKMAIFNPKNMPNNAEKKRQFSP